MTNVTHKFLSVYLFFIYNYLHVSSTSYSSSGETSCINTTCGNCHSVGGRVMCRLGVNSQPAHDTAANTEWQCFAAEACNHEMYIPFACDVFWVISTLDLYNNRCASSVGNINTSEVLWTLFQNCNTFFFWNEYVAWLLYSSVSQPMLKVGLMINVAVYLALRNRRLHWNAYSLEELLLSIEYEILVITFPSVFIYIL